MNSKYVVLICALFKMGQPGPFSVYFRSFQTNIITIFTTNQREKCHVHPVYGAGIRTQDLSNMRHLPKPLDQSSSPLRITLKIDLGNLARAI